MEFATFLTCASFAMASTITPGPNSVLITASAANFGILRTLPHVAGVAIGMVTVITLTGIGLSQLFVTFPLLHLALRVFAGLYLIYLAYRIATSTPADAGTASARPFRFIEAAGFQWINPKVWALGTSAITLFAPEATPLGSLAVAVTFAGVGAMSNSLWAALGSALRHLLSTPRNLRTFNLAMALLLLSSLWSVFF